MTNILASNNQLQEYQETRTLSQVKKDLKNLKIGTKDEAINWLNFLSAVSSAEKSIKEKAYKKLDSCVECDYYEASNGNQVQKVVTNKKSLVKDAYLNDLERRLAELKEEIKDYEKILEKRGEYTLNESRYYKSV